jgi:UDP:flavonoid glycosyltransferase YjiC (YdhE family)
LPADDFIHESAWLNLYIYPPAIDYRRARPLGPHWRNLGASVRATDEPWNLPGDFSGDSEPLVYLSLGSLGSSDVVLMRSLVDELAEAPFRFIVSKGPQADEFELATNMIGAEFLPQTSILPQVDIVISHGGNNTVSESLYFGKRLVILPIFWDQHDNARRISETGLGDSLPTYRRAPGALTSKLHDLLADEESASRIAKVSAGLRAAPGTSVAAELIAAIAINEG